MSRPIHDGWFRVVGIALLMALVLATDDTYQQPINGQWLTQLLIAFSSIVIIWHSNRAIIVYGRMAFFGPKQRLWRWLITLLSCTVATTVLTWLMGAVRFELIQGTLAGYIEQDQAFALTLNHTTFQLASFGFDWFLGLISACFYNSIYGIFLFIKKVGSYRQRMEIAEREKELLRVANLQSQFEVLKQQVNPHFLFNALNSLSALISEDPARAEEFVDKLSWVYRYVLRANEQQLTSLSDELTFIEAYYNLLQTRYGEGLVLHIDVDTAYIDYQLPPLTLQLLVENAVKHNIVSPQQPLAIHIASKAPASLLIRNTLQRKKSRVLSNGVGLNNILAKYQMMNLPTPMIEETASLFSVTLPLHAPITQEATSQ